MLKNYIKYVCIFVFLFLLFFMYFFKNDLISDNVMANQNFKEGELLTHKVFNDAKIIRGENTEQIIERYFELNKAHIVPDKLIAHAGGRINGFNYTNCKEALDKSYERGFKFIEVDLEWTTDNQPVLLHGWDRDVTVLFGVDSRRYSLSEFKEFNMINNWNQMTLNDLACWIREHPDVYIVTDVKSRNLKLLSLICDNYPDIQNQIIPQIYSRKEYQRVNDLGYNHIIFTLYTTWDSSKKVINFAKENELFAITMPVKKAKTSLPRKLEDIGVFTYSHTINEATLFEELERKGINGVYTDDLVPELD